MFNNFKIIYAQIPSLFNNSTENVVPKIDRQKSNMTSF